MEVTQEKQKSICQFRNPRKTSSVYRRSDMRQYMHNDKNDFHNGSTIQVILSHLI